MRVQFIDRENVGRFLSENGMSWEDIDSINAHICKHFPSTTSKIILEAVVDIEEGHETLFIQISSTDSFEEVMQKETELFNDNFFNGNPSIFKNICIAAFSENET